MGAAPQATQPFWNQVIKKIINTCREAKFLERSLEVIVSFIINIDPVGIRLD